MERRLAAIFAADVVGYSRLMEIDEVGTLAALNNIHRDLIDPEIVQRAGRIVKLMGDGMLVEFSSVIDAVACAVTIQRAMAERNVALPEPTRIVFRIGINLGDVIVENEDIFGDGVNVAARLESMAEPGGICVSGAVFDQLKQKIDVGYEYLGELQVKNLAEPIRTYRVILAPRAVGVVSGKSVQRSPLLQFGGLSALIVVAVLAGYAIWPRFEMSNDDTTDFCQLKTRLALPDRPSIAVLPFDNFSSDSEQQHLGDVASQTIVTALAKVPDLFVIANNSTETYKGQAVTPQTVAKDLGVRYVLEGSVQQVADRMRMSAKLIDTSSGEHVWAERYDLEAEKSFEAMDQIAFSILTELEVNLTEGEQARMRSRATTNIEAYQLYIQSTKEQLRLSPEGNANAVALAKRATELDPNFWGGWVALGYASSTRYWYGEADKGEALQHGLDLAQKAFDVGGDDLPDAHLLVSFVENWRGNHEKSIELARKALLLSPNMADAWGQLGISLNSAGRPHEAIPVLENAMRLSPYYATYILLQLAKAQRHTGRHEDAILANRKLICRSPELTFAWRDAALSYGALGQENEAQKAIAALLKIQPDYSIRDYIDKGDSGIDPEVRSRNIEILRRAGLPD